MGVNIDICIIDLISNTEWNGDWSDYSDKWTEQNKKKLNFILNDKDGIFWMPVDDFVIKFSTLNINYFHPEYLYESLQVKLILILILNIS